MTQNGDYEHLKVEKEEYEEFKIRVRECWKELFKKYPNAQI